MSKKSAERNKEILKKWEYNLIFTLLILLIMATILDLGISFDKILEIISQIS
ncbi:MAG: hypothetical protein ACOCQS_01010 [Bacillota bacterium]